MAYASKWTEEKTSQLVTLCTSDHTARDIADAMGLSIHSVTSKLQSLGLKAAPEQINYHRNAPLAHMAPVSFPQFEDVSRETLEREWPSSRGPFNWRRLVKNPGNRSMMGNSSELCAT